MPNVISYLNRNKIKQKIFLKKRPWKFIGTFFYLFYLIKKTEEARKNEIDPEVSQPGSGACGLC
jgi:hypothetical protein